MMRQVEPTLVPAQLSQRQERSESSRGEGASLQKKKFKLSREEFLPRRFGLNFNPPMIILEYMVKSRGKLYLKKMKLFKLKPTTSTEVALKYLKMRYPDFFATEKIPEPQIMRLVD